MKINKEKNIGKVLFIVEGSKTEFYLLRKIFTNILDYNFEQYNRAGDYKKYTSKTNRYSQVFVINTEESNIKFINKDNEYLNNLYSILYEDYSFDIDNAAIYYIFDRDIHSNTDDKYLEFLLSTLTNSRDNNDYYMQGVLLLSYPAIESFTLSVFNNENDRRMFSTGNELKRYLHECNYNHQKIDLNGIRNAASGMLDLLEILDIKYDIDDLGRMNTEVYEFERKSFDKDDYFLAISLLSIALLDLGILEIEE